MKPEKIGNTPVAKARVISKPTRKHIAEHFSTSLMSNSKWRKMFSMLGPLNADVKLEQAIVKLIDDDAEHVIEAPSNAHLKTPWAFIDIGSFGPIALSEIEWIEFPAYAEYKNRSPNGSGKVPNTRVAQNIDKAEAVIAKLGKYPLERTARGIRIVGHIRTSKLDSGTG